jgi:lipid-A-disaccharide synthase
VYDTIRRAIPFCKARVLAFCYNEDAVALHDNMKRILFVAGEPSGDMNGAYVVRALKACVSDLDAYGVGGPEMDAVGFRSIHNITELSVIGAIEPIRHFPRLKRVFDDLLQRIATDTPDAVVLIDYPGFNLRLAKRIKRAHPSLPVIYFISPQIWAWGHRRIHTIRRVIDLMLVLFPFEVDVYEKGGRWREHNGRWVIREHHFWRPSPMQTRYVGHPLVHRLERFVPDADFRTRHGVDADRPIVALLPGSRANEITTIFPVMLQATELLRQQMPEVQILISCGQPGLEPLMHRVVARASIADFAQHYRIIPQALHNIVHISDLVIAKSGTSAFEAALLLKPVLVLYRIHWIGAMLLRRLASIPYVNLANIIAGRRIVPEFLQEQMQPAAVAASALRLLQNRDAYATVVRDLRAVREVLGHGDPGARAAHEICRFLDWPCHPPS